MLRRGPAVIVLSAGLMVITAGTAGLLLTRHPAQAVRPPPAGVAAVPRPAATIAAVPRPVQTAPPARPVALTIPLIGIRTRLITLGLTTGGALQVPSSTAVAGWYTGSARPGAIGSAIIVGHIDSVRGPGVFFRLSELRPGDAIYVRRADRSTAKFRVTAVRRYRKARFPTGTVYGPTPDPELRLITCGGAFDEATGHYLSNTVVYAAEVGGLDRRPAGP